jgi:hypothetical protein
LVVSKECYNFATHNQKNITTMKSKLRLIIVFFLGILVGFILADEINIDQEKEGKGSPKTENKIKNKSSKEKKDKNITIFKEPQRVLDFKRFKVEKVFDNGNALATVLDNRYGDMDMRTSTTVLFLADESSNYFDDQKIVVPKGKVAKQIGTYKYKEYTYSDTQTLPIVAFFDKESK